MMEKTAPLTATCSYVNIRPAMVDLPYPPIQAEDKNQAYANLLSIDHCGSVSELTSITQYINNENRLSDGDCMTGKTLLGIAMAEMMHLQKLGECIVLLGGNIDYTAKMQNGRHVMWTPAYLKLPENRNAMLSADIDAERAAIQQYQMHMKMIKDRFVDALLARIIQDEEYHIMLLQSLLKAQ